MIVPCTFRPNEESEFVLRLFLMKKQKGVVQSAGEEESEIDDEKDEDSRPISDKNEQIFFDFFSKLAGRDRAVSGEFSDSSLLDGALSLSTNQRAHIKLKTLNHILAWELQDLLNRVVKKSYEMDDVFHLETCRALVALSDEDKSGRLNFDEFKQIWLGVRSWIETFLKFDQGMFTCLKT